MKKDNICPDGFPEENQLIDGRYNGRYACDNCDKEIGFNDGFRVDAIGEEDGEEIVHLYSFCDQKCAEEFAHDNGLKMVKATESDDLETIYKFVIDTAADDTAESSDPVADAVKSIMTDDAAAESAAAEPTDEQPALVDDVHERKAAECLKEVVKRAMEISDLSSKISSEKEYLKSLQKEYDTLVKRQQEYILENANGIQLTFSDCDPTPDAGKTGQPDAAADEPAADPNAVAVDTMGWRMTPSSQLPIKLTDKQWAAVDAAFPTLGDLQDWLCQDRREKVPGVSQTVYDKLVDALNDYVTEYTARALNQEKTDEEPADESNDD